jgi:FAD:protein FMN transferase
MVLKQIKTMAALIAGIGIIIFFLSACEHAQSREVMGTFSEIKADNPESIDSAYREIERIEEIMSIYNNSSEISKLNKEKTILPSKELLYVINQSLYFSEISEGSFDITIQPLLHLYTKTFREMNRPPTDEEITAAIEKVGYHKIVINNTGTESINLVLLDNASIDLGGIAKGYSIDRALTKIRKGIVNIGGDIGIKNKDYSIALSNPDKKDDFIAVFRLDNGCIATSGNYERYFDKTRKIHHIMDPRTGKSSQGLISVTILGKNKKSIECDALATAIFVMGKEKGIRLIESLDGFETLMIDEDNIITKSNNLNTYILK